VTGLVEYSICPKRFKYNYVDGHPGIGDGNNSNARTIGTLTHTALELDIDDADKLAPLSDGASESSINEAIGLARVFRDIDDFSAFRLGGIEREVPVSFELNGIKVLGKADLVGDDFVLDFKTDSEMLPRDHAIQLWAYAKALDKQRAAIAYLRHARAYTYTLDELAAAGTRAEACVDGLSSARFVSTPSESACRRCSYSAICDERYKE
jgi:ATP-dependent helicase/nuclease subunit A